MKESENLARLLYGLECTINQRRVSDWKEQTEAVKEEWINDAQAIIKLGGG